MSYFLFGSVVPMRQAFVEHAAQHGLIVQTKYPEILDEMFQLTGADPDMATRFLISASVEDDTSDALISPFAVSPGEVCANLGALQAWLEEVISQLDVRVTLYVTEGFDNQFRRIAVGATRLQETLSSIFQGEGNWWPSLMLSVERG